MKTNKLTVVLGFCLLALASTAQRGDSDTLKRSEIRVFKEYEPQISGSFKLSDNPQLLDTVVQIDKDVPYKVRTKRVPTSYAPESIKPAKMKGIPLNKLYKGYGHFGMGNFLTTRAELVLNNTRSRKWDYGFTAWHHGSNGGVKERGNSGFSDNNFQLYGKKFLYNTIVSGKLKYDLNTLHRYGFNPDLYTNTAIREDSLSKANTAQNFNNISPELKFKTYFKDSTKLNFDVDLKYYHYWDKFNSQEDNVLIGLKMDRYFNKEFGQLEAWLDVNSFGFDGPPGTTRNNSTNFGIKPKVVAIRGDFKLRLGAELAWSNLGSSQVYVYPDVYVKYDLVKDIIIPYVGLGGGLQRNNFRNLTRQNPFLVSDPTLTNQNTRINIYGGIRGEIARNLSFNVGVGHRNIENLALFVNVPDTLGGFPIQNQFDAVYDDASITDIKAEIGYQKPDKFNFLLSGEYFLYNMKNQKAPWHMPNIKINFNGRYNIGDKIQLTADIFFIGEREARAFTAAGNKDYGDGVYAVTLDPLIDLNLGFEYFFGPRWTVYLKFYNLANSRYAVYNEYYQQGVTILGGTTFKFWGDKKRKK